MKKEKFDIQGMTCSSCSSHVEKAAKKLNGIKSVSVNLLSNNMVVEYDETILNSNQIIASVIEAGYGAQLSNDTKQVKNEKKVDNSDVIKSMKKRLIISVCFLIPLMYIAMHHMLNEWFGLPIPQIIKDLFHGTENALNYAFTQLLLLLPIVYVNRNYFIVGFKRLFKRTPNMDSLIALGSFASIAYGIFAIYMIAYGFSHSKIDIVQKYSMDIYFESAGTILTLITVGKYLETKSKGKTSEAISKLINLAPKTATVVREEKEVEIALEKIIVGDIIIVKPGSSIPVDGIVIEGTSSIDQSSITGESMPVTKKVGDNIVSGTINKNGYIKMQAVKVGNDTTLSQIVKLVEEASNSKAPIAKLADKVSGIFVPVVILISILATIFWLINGQSFEFALSIGIAVLVISCPCALGLATPVAIMVGTGMGAQNGILIKSAESLETLHLVNTVVLDKTGTITVGKPKVTDLVSDIEQKELLEIAGSLEKNSEHPLAEAIMEKVKQENIELKEINEFISVPGRGVKGQIDGVTFFGGNLAFMKENDINVEDVKSDELLKQGKTVIYFANSKSIEVVMLTGDNKVVAQTIGENLKIDKIISEVMPADKEREVAKLQEQGKKVAFVGDGINDSPALAKADVGIAIGSGTDIAIESADVVLMKNTILDVANAIDLSRAVIKNIKMNLFWAFFYNAIGIPVAAGVFYLNFGFKLSPMIGAAAMSLSSVCVVTNALRLKKFKPKYKEENKKMETKTIIVEGMQCNHCKMSVEKALGAIEGVVKVEVNLESKTATIESTMPIDDNKIKAVIEEEGFEIN